MYILNATHATLGTSYRLDLDTASKEELEQVANPAKLPPADKLKYFARKAELEAKARVSIVSKHHARLKNILFGLKSRALGPSDDEVHQKLKAAAIKLTSILNIHMEKAKAGSKDFNELKLVNDLRPPLQDLKEHLADVDDTPKHMDELAKARVQVGDVLARGEAGVKAWVRGASIGYRGSLATGWRNALKSVQGTAQRINLQSFDSDAFINVPHEIWSNWADLEVVTEREREGKLDLSELITRAKAVIGLNRDNPLSLQLRQRILDQLQGLKTVEDQLRLAMGTVKGYKKIKDQADFSFVLQSSRKTGRELASGNLYPLSELANAGLPLTESDLDLVFESGVLKVRMVEKHVNISEFVPKTTYPWDAPHPPHTQSRPTEAMQIKAYLGMIPEQSIATFLTNGADRAISRELAFAQVDLSL